MKTKLNEYVKVAEAAEILGVSQGTLRNWAEAGQRLQLHFLPPYCRDDKKFERVWQDLHAKVTEIHTRPTVR